MNPNSAIAHILATESLLRPTHLGFHSCNDDKHLKDRTVREQGRDGLFHVLYRLVIQREMC